MELMSSDHSYDDIINMPHHVSSVHMQMPRRDRAAQFASFAALTGYDDEIKETARLTDSKPELDDDAKSDLNSKHKLIREHIGLRPALTVTFFIPDEKKSGGSLFTMSASIKSINEYDRTLIFENGVSVHMDDIVSIDGELFEKIK